MALQNTDNLIISRGGANKRASLQDLQNYITQNIGSSEFTVANITDRNNIPSASISLGDRVFVQDASADANVAAGWAIYTWNGTAYVLIAKEEALTVTAPGTNLTASSTTDTVTINSSTGSGVALTGATQTKAGIMTTGQVDDLTSLMQDKHKPVTTNGTAADNPITIDANQVVSFNIDALDPA